MTGHGTMNEKRAGNMKTKNTKGAGAAATASREAGRAVRPSAKGAAASRRPAAEGARAGGALTPAMLAHASAVLGELLTFSQPADGVLSGYFREHRQLGGRERAFIAETCYQVLRHKRQLERLVQPAHGARWLVLAALLRHAGLAQKQLAEVVSVTEREWLQALKSGPEPVWLLAERLDFPDWLVARLADRFSEAALIELAQGLNGSAPLDVRVQTP